MWARFFFQSPAFDLFMRLTRWKPACVYVCVCTCTHAFSVNLEAQLYNSSHIWRQVALAATMSLWVPPSVLMCIVGNACSPDSVTAVHSHRITSRRCNPPHIHTHLQILFSQTGYAILKPVSWLVGSFSIRSDGRNGKKWPESND